MIIDVILNQGTINITNPSEVKSGVTPSLIPAGAYKILFADFGYVDYTDADYSVFVQPYDGNGVKQGFTLGTLEADGINIVLSFDSYVHFITNK